MDGDRKFAFVLASSSTRTVAVVLMVSIFRPPLFEFIPHARIMMRLVENVYHKFLVTAQ